MEIAPPDSRNPSELCHAERVIKGPETAAAPVACGLSLLPPCFAGPMSGSDARRWYVFRANLRQEALAEANLTAQGFEHFLPKCLVTKRHARRLITKRDWLFPRYGFVALDLTRDRWRSVNGTLGVERLVMGNDGPQAVPHGIIEALSACVDDRGLFDPNTGLKPGDTVRVTTGVFAGALGELQSLDAKGRIELLLHWLNGTVRVKLARGWVEAAA